MVTYIRNGKSYTETVTLKDQKGGTSFEAKQIYLLLKNWW